ncbi:MAG: hypothetical protein ABIW79_11020 [Gemmatimonas sp.]
MPPSETPMVNPGIFMTKSVYDGYIAAVGAETARREGWATYSVTVPGYTGPIYGSYTTLPFSTWRRT